MPALQAKSPTVLGTKVRALRRRENLTQANLAQRLGISASYLNLIEHNKRPLTAPLLIKLAQLFQLDLHEFSADDDARMFSDLLEVFGDPMFETHGLTNADMKEFAATSPAVARAVLNLYRAFQDSRDSTMTLADQLAGGEELPGVDYSRISTEEVTDFLHRHNNHFHELEDQAERLWETAHLEHDNILPGLIRTLEEDHGVTVKVMRAGTDHGAVRRYDPARQVLTLSELLPPRSRNFQLAHQIGLLNCSPTFSKLTNDERLTTESSRTLARVALANYFAGAVLMPYTRFVEAAQAVRYDIELLGHRFRTSFEQVCHRVTTLQRPGMEGIPFHFVRVDIAGNISKRYGGSGIRFARFSAACPRWNVHAAFLTPGHIRLQLSQTTDGSTYFCIARTLTKDSGGYREPRSVHAIGLGCEMRYAPQVVYADGVDLSHDDALVPIGITCRLCDRTDCEQRAFPPVHQPMTIDENVRGKSFYANIPPTKK